MKHKLETEDDELDSDGRVYLFFHTKALNYAFVDDLNRLYHLALARQEDLELDKAMWPNYFYFDPMAKLEYLLVERPADSGAVAGTWLEGHKVLIVQGDDAEERVQRMYEDFVTPQPPQAEVSPHAEWRRQTLEAYQRDLTAVSIYPPDDNGAQPLSKKAAKSRLQLDDLLMRILDERDKAAKKTLPRRNIFVYLHPNREPNINILK